jgi:hypothetical protein
MLLFELFDESISKEELSLLKDIHEMFYKTKYIHVSELRKDSLHLVKPKKT